MIFRRHQDPDLHRQVIELKDRLQQQEQQAEKAKQTTDEIAQRSADLRDKAVEIGRRNHLAEAVRQSFEEPGLIDIIRRKLPWVHSR